VSAVTSRVAGVSTALYRRYRPETFAEVIGQDHVTAPLMQALRTGRVNHAYLFSGPRGCGKTTSARILARTLNCAQNTPENPIDTPCGVCPSCTDLARGGPGSLDVVEIDAASHGGVDDARDLRERATFAPTRDRYKIFVIDEAHMVSPAGFNALLKIVEEPPEHIKFVFATTEPDKVIGTIRSRTHHYPFRLVPPDVLGPYLEELCAAEGVSVGSGVVPLVTRAGGGSVRDSLSVLDQLIAGAEGGALEYARAVALLGFTHATLLDDVVDALAARDGASIFRIVDHVIATGHEPRRFVEDVLERLRDLIVIAVSGDEAQAVLRDQPADQLERMRTQAQNLGVAELSRAADLVNAALTEMTGATSPRLHLELLMARLLLPGSDDGAAGFAARLDRLERGGLGTVAVAPAAPGRPTSAVSDGGHSAASVGSPPASSGLTGPAAVRAALRPPRTPQPAVQDPAPDPAVQEVAPRPAESPSPAAPAATATAPAVREQGPTAPEAAPEAAPELEPGEGTERAGSTEPAEPAEPAESSATEPEPVPQGTGEVDAGRDEASSGESVAVARPAPSVASSGATPALTTEELRRRWPEVLENLRASPVTWSLVSANAQVVELGPDVLYLAFPSPGLARTFSSSRHTGAVQDVVYQTLGLQVRIEPRLAEDGPAGPPGPGPSGPPRTAAGPEGGSAATADRPASGGAPAGAAGPVGSGASAASPPAAVAASTSSTGGVAPGGPPAPTARARVGEAGAPVRGAVALQERPVVVDTVPVTVVDAADEAWLAGAPAPAPPPGAGAADDAWLAGTQDSEPPADLDDGPEPEPVLEPVPSSTPAAVVPPAAPPRHAGSPALSGASAARAAIAAATSSRGAVRPAEEPARRTAPAAIDPMDDVSSDDDADLTSTGLVGTALVVSLLSGKVIEEIQDQGL
jgi:DNA polymerase-3 subunit gamma/tau